MKKISLILFIILLSFTIYGCATEAPPIDEQPIDDTNPGENQNPNDNEDPGENEDPTDTTDPWITIANKLDQLIPSSIQYSLDLVQYDEETNATIQWSSSIPQLLDHSGRYFSTSQVQPIIVSANVQIGEEAKTYTFSRSIGKNSGDQFDTVWDYIAPRLSRVTRRNFNFRYNHPTIDSSVEYFSSDENILNNEGIIYRALYNQEVELIIKIRVNSQVRYYRYQVTVGDYSDGEKRDLIYNWLEDQVDALFDGTVKHLPHTHPEFGGKIKWSSSVAGVVTIDGRMVKPIFPEDIVFFALVQVGDTVRMKSISSQLPGYGLEQEETFLVKYLENIILSESWGVLNLYQPNGPDIISSIVPDRSKMTSGIKKPMTQTALDANMYPGYTIPNSDNVLWIVIHESGMPQIGNDADKLNEIMLRKQIDNSAQSSWHYTVDAYKIFHHIPDNEIAWHAGGGSGQYTFGNSNGIGIEMCINEDGNYEGALRNYAKLVAHLLIKYELTLANIKQHYDFAQKNCPAYMRNDNRWFDFLDLIQKEYILQKYLSTTTFNWSVDQPEMLRQLNGDIYEIVPKAIDTMLNLTLEVEINGTLYQFHYETLVKANT